VGSDFYFEVPLDTDSLDAPAPASSVAVTIMSPGVCVPRGRRVARAGTRVRDYTVQAPRTRARAGTQAPHLLPPPRLPAGRLQGGGCLALPTATACWLWTTPRSPCA
jgi:hypothetical protein